MIRPHQLSGGEKQHETYLVTKNFKTITFNIPLSTKWQFL